MSGPTWTLDPGVTFLNHGSFGATPLQVQDVQSELRARMEREPVDFMVRQLPGLLDAARARAAAFVGSDAADLVYVVNATQGVNAVVASLASELGPDDEILTTDHRYDAVFNTLHHHGRVVVAPVPFPTAGHDEIAAAVVSAITERTRLLVLDQVTSPTGIVLPVQRIARAAQERGVLVLCDGAHAPGQLHFRVDELGVDFWTGNLHKWVCAPKGSALLWVSRQHQARIHPTAISHGYKKGLSAEFDWSGTFDPTAWLASPAAMDLHDAQPGLREANHALVQRGRQVIADAVGTRLPHPDDPALYGSLATILLDDQQDQAQQLNHWLFHEHRIEVPIIPWGGRRWVRVSGQAYNRPEHYERLAAALAVRLRIV